MEATPVSLIERLCRASDVRQEDWDRLVALYTPLLYSWARQGGLQDADAADLVQDVLTILVRELPRFRYDPARTFRGWLRAVTLNRWRERRRRRQPQSLPLDSPQLAEQEQPDNLSVFEEDEYRRYIARRALALMQEQFQTHTWRACWETVVHGRKAGEVAAELGVSLDVVYTSTSRVLRRLREELRGLLD